jgi:hypothetical protein
VFFYICKGGRLTAPDYLNQLNIVEGLYGELRDFVGSLRDFVGSLRDFVGSKFIFKNDIHHCIFFICIIYCLIMQLLKIKRKLV